MRSITLRLFQLKRTAFAVRAWRRPAGTPTLPSTARPQMRDACHRARAHNDSNVFTSRLLSVNF